MNLLKTYLNPTTSEQSKLLIRPSINAQKLDVLLDQMTHELLQKGDQALRTYTKLYDKVDISEIEITQEEIHHASKVIPDDLKKAIEIAAQNIRKFHTLQFNTGINYIETSPGVTCWQKSVAIEKVGIYVPGGTAPLFSTVLMLAIPAQIAGCKEIILCTPPSSQGTIDPAILYTASITGVTQICQVGGAQAVLALALGTDTIPKVNKIFGPGNQYVTAAKQRALQLGIAIDLPAGPSEVLVFADRSCVPAFVASDLLAQAEHGIDSQVVLVTTDRSILPEVEKALADQLKSLPRRDIATKAMENSFAVSFHGIDECFDFINDYAPEHLILATTDADKLLDKIINAGSVFVGNYTPESAGDYASGTNHTLPTSGFARAFSGVNMDAFCKKITYQKITKEGLQNLGPSIVTMAKAEQLHAHANSVSFRLDNIESEGL